MDFTQDIADYIGNELDHQWPDAFQSFVYPPHCHGVMLTNGNYLVFREYGMQHAIRARDVSDRNLTWGSTEFMETFITPIALGFGEEINEQQMDRGDGIRELAVRSYVPRKVSSAPYHWSLNFAWRNIPFTLESRVLDDALHLRYGCVLATLEAA